MKKIFLIPTAILFGALLSDLPYGYFQILRWTTCITAVLFANESIRWFKQPVPSIFIAIAILFNPVLPIHLSRSIWIVLDLITGIIFLGWIFKIQILKRIH